MPYILTSIGWPAYVMFYKTIIKLISAILLHLIAATTTATAASSPQIAPDVISDIEQYLSSLKTIAANFTQISPDGSMASGKFYLKRPHKMRWQYNPPTPILMVTRGGYLTYYDYELNQVSDIPLENTILGFLAQPKISFNNSDIIITDMYSEPGIITLTLAQKSAMENGNLSLEFADSPIQLRNIQVTDSNGQTTHITLTDARFNIPLDDAIFQFKDPRISGTNRRKK